MHQAVGTIIRHDHGRAIMEGRVDLDDGPDQIDTSLIQERHDELAKEMEKRGMNHDSPMDYTDHWDLGELDIEANLKELRERCDDCAKRIKENALDEMVNEAQRLDLYDLEKD